MTPISQYLAQLDSALKAGNSTEHTHRPALKALIEALADGVVATNEPARIECGSPDFIVTRKGTPLGYVEAKDIGVDLGRAEDSEQLRRYRASLRNLVLTDYLEFRLYRNGEQVLSSRLGKWHKNGVLKRDVDGVQQVERLLQWFFEADVPTVASPRELAERMARVAKLLHDLIRQVFAHQGQKGDLRGQYEAFKKVLLADLSVDQFADMYAQTIAYGLFAARCNHIGTGFTREDAGRELPKTNPFLRKLFNTIAGADLDERIAWAVDDLADLLGRADMAAVLKDFGRVTRREDPVVHFYETFLAAYDPKLRETRGVYYTPEPVVGYIVRSIDAILKRDFGLKDGLADKGKVKLTIPIPHGKPKIKTIETHRVQILDPAVGTGTFLHQVVACIHERFALVKGLWPSYVAEHLLPRLYGFELLMAPYAVAHMKLGLQLQETGYDFAADERLRVFLTNSLEEAHESAGLPLFAQWLADEAAAASEVKREVPIMVVLGNPPYSGHSVNKGEWIEQLLTEYKREPTGGPLKERNSKWLNDDYVKFIRFAHWRVMQTGHGVVGFITNHGWLDNPTFRGMRASLLRDFDAIHVLDLHGNSKKKEIVPGGEKDENVFDIQQGVAVCLLVRLRTSDSETKEVRHADVWGQRAAKYEWLAGHDVMDTPWVTFSAKGPQLILAPQDEVLLSEYEQGWLISEVFPVNSVGIVTARDSLTIHFTREEAWSTVRDFASLSPEEARNKYELGDDSQDWKVALAQGDLTVSGRDPDRLVPILYRPFDLRWTYYTGKPSGFHCRPRNEVMKHMLFSNVALVLPQQTKDDWGVFATAFIAAHKASSRYDISSLAPLWVYGSSDSPRLFDTASSDARAPNLSPAFVTDLKSRLGADSVAPEDAFAYIYAVLHSPGYRARYGSFLKRGFPRVPLTTNARLFQKLATLGKQLIDLHLMRATSPQEPGYPVAGNNRVDTVAYKAGRVHINVEQYFDGVSQAAWEYYIGGYQVANKWLKDRRGRLLTFDELSHYRRVVAALTETITIQEEIDSAIPEWPIV